MDWPLTTYTPVGVLTRTVMYCGTPATQYRGGKWPKNARPRFLVVMGMTGLSLGYATALCEWAGCNPDEMVIPR